MAYAHIPDVQRDKLDKKAEKLQFVGYNSQSKGYRLLDGRTAKVVDVIFNEEDFGHETSQVQQKNETEVDVHSVEEARTEPEAAEERNRYPERQRCVPLRFGTDEYMPMQLLWKE